MSPPALQVVGLSGAIPGRLVPTPDESEHLIAIVPATTERRSLRLEVDPGGFSEMAVLQVTLGGQISGGIRVDFRAKRLATLGTCTGNLRHADNACHIELTLPEPVSASQIAIALARDGNIVFPGTGDQDALAIKTLGMAGPDGIFKELTHVSAPVLRIDGLRRLELARQWADFAHDEVGFVYHWPSLAVREASVVALRQSGFFEVRIEASASSLRTQFEDVSLVVAGEGRSGNTLVQDFRSQVQMQLERVKDGTAHDLLKELSAKLPDLVYGIVPTPS